MSRHRPLFLACVALATALPALAQGGAGRQSEVTEVARATGRATSRDDLTPAEVKAQALRAAYRDAIEQALGTQVSSAVELVTQQHGGVVSERFHSLIRELPSGLVTRHEVVEDAWEGGGAAGTPATTYRVTIRAWVRPDPARSAPGFQLSVALNARTFVDRGTPESSDELVLKVSSSADVFLTVFLFSSDDSVEVLFPNQYVPSVRAAAGTPTEIPSPQLRQELGLRLRTTLPAGVANRVERLTVVATRSAVPFAGVARRPDGDTARVPTVRDTFDAFALWLVGIAASDRAVADATYEIVRGAPR